MRGLTSTILLGAAFIGTLIGLSPTDEQPSAASGAAAGSDTLAATRPVATVRGCRAVDGDTLNCSGERIRLLGIDAPELPGHCRVGRNCAPGDPYASTASLARALRPSLPAERVGKDRYGRTLALVGGSGHDLSCLQLRGGFAVYRADYDDGGRVARRCPDLT